MRKINVESNRSPLQKHSRYLKSLKKQSVLTYRLLMRRMVNEIVETLIPDQLSKSEKLGPGWTGATPKITLNVEEVANGVISKYLSGLRWVMIGDYAGADAKKAAKKIGIYGEVTPGLMQSSYLSAIDAYRQLYTDMTGNKAGDIPSLLLQGSIEQIVERTDRYLNQVTAQLNNTVLLAIERLTDDINSKTTSRIHRKAQGKEDSEKALEDAVSQTRNAIKKTPLLKELREATKSFENNWQRTSVGELGTATAAATHQAMHEVFGSGEDEMRVAWVTSENERVCKFCNSISKDGAGGYKYYRLDELKPAGYNIGKKRANWLAAVPPVHPNCYCYLVYVPKGFKVTAGGDLMPE